MGRDRPSPARKKDSLSVEIPVTLRSVHQLSPPRRRAGSLNQLRITLLLGGDVGSNVQSAHVYTECM